VEKSSLFVDRRESTLNEAGDFLLPKKEGAIDDDHIKGEIGDVLLGQIGGRTSAQEITLFKSLGLAAEDVAAANHIYQKLVKQNKGLWVEFGALKSE
jgi:ornithine cyclodeaminase